MGICYNQINKVIITDTQNERFYGKQDQLMQKYKENQLYYRTLSANGDVSVMVYSKKNVTFTQKQYIMTSKQCFKCNQLSKPLRYV